MPKTTTVVTLQKLDLYFCKFLSKYKYNIIECVVQTIWVKTSSDVTLNIFLSILLVHN